MSVLKLLSNWTTNRSASCSETPLFSGSAYFSSCVPKIYKEKWGRCRAAVAHGGGISSGTTFDVHARYFFAVDPAEPWAVKLFAKSVMVIHAGWIAHCVDEAFQVPIAEYILDDRFVPGPPYRSTNNALPIYVPLSEPGEPSDNESSESSSMPDGNSEAPSTPTSMSRKRKREQAYFDSPSGSLVFSGFDKDGMPQRPRKLRKLRFDPSFSPGGGRSGGGETRGTLDWLQDLPNPSKDDVGTSALRDLSYITAFRSPNTPDKPLACEEPSATYRCLSVDENVSNRAHVSSPVVSVDMQEKKPPIRTIDFTKLPPRTRRWHLPATDATYSKEIGAIPSAVMATDHRVKTPKKISFAEHARVCVYMVSPQRPGPNDDVGALSVRQSFIERSKDVPQVNEEPRVSRDGVEDLDDSTTKTIKDLSLRANSPRANDGPTRLLGVDQFEGDTLTLTMGDVQGIRHRLVNSTTENGDSQLATLFELGKTFRGMTFRHVW